MGKTVAYFFKDHPKVTIEELLAPMVDLCAAKHGLTIESVYADGFVGVPKGGWDSLAEDFKKEKITHVITPNLSRWHGQEELLLRDLRHMLSTGATLVVSQADFINNGVVGSSKALAQVVVLIKSERYFKDVKGLRIRAGMKATDKTIGNTPYGMRHTKQGLVVDTEQFSNVSHIMKASVAGIPVGDIARAMNMTYDKVRGIIKYWEDLKWEEMQNQ